MAYSYEPLADEPGCELGGLYVVMEALVSGRASEEVTDLIIETIGDQYYNHEHPGLDALSRFEAAIKATNHELSEYVNRGNAAWIGKLSAVVAIQVESELHVAQTGSAEAFLYRGKAATHVTAGGPGRPSTPTKTFGSIATGQLEPGDRILLATPALIHQVPLERLQSIIGHSSPNAAIAEITHLLKGASVERVAALIIEITTAELAALQVRSDEPSEIQLGTPENAIEAAKLVAAPIAQTTVASSKKVASAAQAGWQRAKPHAKAAGLAAAGQIRNLLNTRSGRRAFLASITIIVVIFAAITIRNSFTAQSEKLFANYQAAYNDFTHAQQLLDQGDKTDAHDGFIAVQHKLAGLQGNERQINAKLKHAAIPEGEPRSFTSLSSLINDRLDQIDGLVKVNPTTVVAFTKKNSRVEHFEVLGDKAYTFDDGNANALSIISLSSGSTKASVADTSKLGDVVSTTLSNGNDGIYILTSKPSVWFYRFDNDSLTEQTITFGQWPKASAIASYASNLYLLGSTAVYKHTKNSTGFSPKTDLLQLTDESTRDATALAVDGSVYVLSPAGLHRYVGGSLKTSAPIPGTLGQITNVRVAATSEALIGTSTSTKRIALWWAKDANLEFDKQIALNNTKSLYDAFYDSKSSVVYALTDGRLVRFNVTL